MSDDRRLTLFPRRSSLGQSADKANDLDNLVVTSGTVNSSKGGLDAASWRPPKYGQCGYATRYVIMKHRYHLGVDTSEKAALRQMLATCTDDGQAHLISQGTAAESSVCRPTPAGPGASGVSPCTRRVL